MARQRQRIMGLPIGPKKQTNRLARAAGLSALAVTGLSAVPVVKRTAQTVSAGKETVNAGKELASKVSSHSSAVGKVASLASGLSDLRKDGGDDKPKLSHLIEERTYISVPRSVAYNQWTQMEMLPSIVKGVLAVDQADDDETQWSARIGPVRRQWKAKITEQVPDERIAWRSEEGPEHEGVVTFHSLDEELTRVLVEMRYKPHGPLETVANKLRIQRRRVRRDLRLFKHYLELRGEETGAWRGEIGSGHDGDRPRRAASTATAAAGSTAKSTASSAGNSTRPTRAKNPTRPTRAKTSARKSSATRSKSESTSGGNR